jgi:hypothetical protein
MKFTEFPMHQELGGTIQLINLLGKLPENTWIWSILEFYGVGVPPSGMTMAEFEKAARSIPGGYCFSWPDLKAFARHLDQTYDCLIVAVESKNDLAPIELNANKFDRCQIVLQALDSTKWSIGTNSKLVMEEFTKHFQPA